MCVLTHPGRHGIASADRALHGLATFPGHPGNEDSHGQALWIINAPRTHTDTLMSQVVHNPQNTAYHSLLLQKSLEFAKSSSVCTDCQTGSEATNCDTMSAHKYMHACASVIGRD